MAYLNLAMFVYVPLPASTAVLTFFVQNIASHEHLVHDGGGARVPRQVALVPGPVVCHAHGHRYSPILRLTQALLTYIGTTIAGLADLEYNSIGYVLMLLSNTFSALYAVLNISIGNAMKLNSVEVLYGQAITSLPLALLCALIDVNKGVLHAAAFQGPSNSTFVVRLACLSVPAPPDRVPTLLGSLRRVMRVDLRPQQQYPLLLARHLAPGDEHHRSALGSRCTRH